MSIKQRIDKLEEEISHEKIEKENLQKQIEEGKEEKKQLEEDIQKGQEKIDLLQEELEHLQTIQVEKPVVQEEESIQPQENPKEEEQPQEETTSIETPPSPKIELPSEENIRIDSQIANTTLRNILLSDTEDTL